MKKQTILIVDDHKIFREGIRLLLNQYDFIDKVHCACDGEEYLQMINEISPDIVLMDINMPRINGVEATRRSKLSYPKIKIIALSMHDNVKYYTQMTDSGIDGFITKDTDSDELKLALNKVINNEHYFSRKILQNVILEYNSSSNKEEDVIIFSEREKEIIQKMAEGMSNKEISEQLFISHRTVERHKDNMFKKSNCNNAIKLIVYSVKHKIIQI